MSASALIAPDARVRRAELMAALSMATDLAMGQPMEYAMASCVLAVRLGERAGLRPQQIQDAYYEALLRYIGCNADVAWLASIVGDEIALRREFARIDGADQAASLALMVRSMRAANADSSPLHAARAVMAGLGQLALVKTSFFPGHCEVASRLAQRMGFAPAFVATVGQLYARWDGKGVPALKGDQIAPAMQVVSLAQDAVTFLRSGGIEAVRKMVRQRSGKAHSPRLCSLLLDAAGELLDGLQDAPTWELILALEPGQPVWLDAAALDAACEAIADFADLRSPWHLGHSRRVAGLAADAAQQLSFPNADVTRLRRAGWLHDIGRCGVSASVGALPGPLSERQWELMRLHPYLTERVLSRPGELRELGQLAATHHERLDGSGYAKGLKAAMLDPPARLLIASHRYVSLLEERPHRPALGAAQAAELLAQEARSGALDRQCVDVVLAVSGHSMRPRRVTGAGRLTEREMEVLAHLARGATIKMVARELGLAVKTVDRHVQNIYGKIDVSTRAAATLYAVENGLLD
ncbi:MAG TPA: HD domain-containing phosphohydrolase [Ramlibacter sp.]|nr:HD domain-containing phosphohydrolase [Ramlibacter sp.]